MAWVNPWGYVFSFFKNYEFGGSGDLVLDPKGTENLWGGLGKP